MQGSEDPMSTIDTSGDHVESLVETICHRMFFSDFTVRNPKFKKPTREEKEIADILIPFGCIMIAFQIKTKNETKKASEKTEVDYQRIHKVVDKAISQFKTLKRALINERFSTLTTARGHRITIHPKSITKVIGIVIIDLLGEEDFPPDERSGIFNGFLVEHSFPIHVFMRSDFEAISTEIDTLPDFIEYLNTREVLISNGNIIPTTEELDLLATYKRQYDTLQDAIKKEALIVIDQGVWDYYQHDLRETINKRDWLNKPSYIIDEVISWLHDTLSFDFDEDILGERARMARMNGENYLSVAVELARLSRLERRVIGERFLRCLLKADKIGHGHSAVISYSEKSGVLVLSSKNTSRKERLTALYKLSAMLYCAKNLRKVIGIATEELTVAQRSYDVMILEDVTFTNHDELVEKARFAFGEPRTASGNEYEG
jgi:hypothetical protein